jgi:hypothetical protein
LTASLSLSPVRGGEKKWKEKFTVFETVGNKFI